MGKNPAYITIWRGIYYTTPHTTHHTITATAPSTTHNNNNQKNIRTNPYENYSRQNVRDVQ